MGVKGSRVWIGDGLGMVLKKMYDKMVRWEFVDLAELKVKSRLEKEVLDLEEDKVVVLPGFEVTQARRRPIKSFWVWVQCFARYMVVMARVSPECMPGFMSHMLKSYMEVDYLGWRLYDEVFKEKMAVTGVAVGWSGCLSFPGNLWGVAEM